MSDDVTSHYGQNDIIGNILAALPNPGATRLSPADLFPFDQLHGRELLATRDHVARLAPQPGENILDIGSGIGGPARFIASTFGCDVTGIDLTPQFVAAAKYFTTLTGLDSLVHFDQGDATAMPYEDGRFDASVCFYVGMNLPDHQAVLAEAFRVLKPGGRLLWTEAIMTGAVPIAFPLPWSRTAETSHTVTRATFEAALAKAGFELTAVSDETSAHVELAKAVMQSGIQPPPGVRAANETVLGPDFIEHRKNYIKNLMSGALVSLVFEARRHA